MGSCRPTRWGKSSALIPTRKGRGPPVGGGRPSVVAPGRAAAQTGEGSDHGRAGDPPAAVLGGGVDRERPADRFGPLAHGGKPEAGEGGPPQVGEIEPRP